MGAKREFPMTGYGNDLSDLDAKTVSPTDYIFQHVDSRDYHTLRQKNLAPVYWPREMMGEPHDEADVERGSDPGIRQLTTAH